MIDLFYCAHVRRSDPWKGTSGEMVPTFDIQCYHARLWPKQIPVEKERITKEHIENMKSLPQSWRDVLPVPKFWECPHN